MSYLKIQSLNPEGVHEREASAMEAISHHLPNHWLAYASLELLDRLEGNRELDLVLVAEDRVIVVELKDWNGELKSDGDYWYLNGNQISRSVTKVTELKAKILKSHLSRRLRAEVGNVYVDSCVVLTASANPSGLTAEEQRSTWTLEQFSQISARSKFNRLFPVKANCKFSLCTKKEAFNRFFSPKYFKPKVVTYSGWRTVGEPTYMHSQGLFVEYSGEKKNNTNFKCLIRLWDLDTLPISLNLGSARKQIVSRETNVHSYIKSVAPELESEDALLRQIDTEPIDQITSHFFEIYDLPKNKLRLAEYLNKYRDVLTVSNRMLLIKVMLSRFKRLHELGIAHRDVSASCLWADPSSFGITISRFLSAAIPSAETISDYRDVLQSGSSMLPEDALGLPSTYFQKDVFLLGCVSHFIGFGLRPKTSNNVPEWCPPNTETSLSSEFCTWLEASMQWEPGDRFTDAGNMLKTFLQLPENRKDGFDLRMKLQGFVTDCIPYSDFPPEVTLARSGLSHVYQSRHQGTEVVVKTWNGLVISEDESRNFRLLEFFDAVKKLKTLGFDFVPRIVRSGLAATGPFLVYEMAQGTVLSEFDAFESVEEKLEFCRRLLEAVDSFHDADLGHGDLKPDNILVLNTDFGGRPMFLDFPDLDARAETPLNYRYSPPYFEHCTVIQRDRFAVCKLFADVLGFRERTADSQTEFLTDRAELEELCIELETLINQNSSILGLSTILTSVIRAGEAICRPSRCVHVIKTPRVSHRFTLYPENDSYSVQVLPYKDDPSKASIRILGLNSEFGLLWNLQQEVWEGHFLNEKPDYSSHQQKKKHCRLTLPGLIILEPSKYSDLSALHEFFSGTDIGMSLRGVAVSAPGQKPRALATSTVEPDPDDAKETPSEIGKVWQCFIEAEEKILPEVVITGQIEFLREKRTWVMEYGVVNSRFDFSPDEEVFVFSVDRMDRPVRVGNLNIRETSLDILGIIADETAGFGVGQHLRLQSLLHKASFDRRARAVDRIVRGKSVIPDLVEYFQTSCDRSSEFMNERPSEAEVKKYGLNSSQTAAFMHLVSHSPLGLLQGPPGTGKTMFIAALIHYLLSQGNNRVLLASQSHEAVNTATEKTISYFKKFGQSLELVRVGAEGMLSDPLLPFHTSGLQKAFRNDFLAERTQRLRYVGDALGLPAEFTEKYLEIKLHLGDILRKIRAIELLEVAADHEAPASPRIDSLKETFFRVAEEKFGIQWPSDNLEQLLENYVENLRTDFQIDNPSLMAALEDAITLSEEWINALDTGAGNFEEFLTKTKPLVAGTCVGIGQKRLQIEKHEFDWVIVDEAARCDPSELAVAIQVGRRVLLVGDHMQLPPLYNDEVIKHVAEKTNHEQASIREAVFKKVFNSKYGQQNSFTLLQQYRMAPAIGKLVSELFYDDELETSRGNNPEWYKHLPTSFKQQVIWLDTKDAGDQAFESFPRRSDGTSSKSRENEYEASLVLKVLGAIRDSRDFLKELYKSADDNEVAIGVICMYAAQKELIVKRFRETSWPKRFRRLLKVDTVDSYQGKENQIIILSLTANNATGNIGFVRNPERINVSLSRAQERLIIIGNSSMWQHNEPTPLGRVFDHIARNVGNECEIVDSQKILDDAND